MINGYENITVLVISVKAPDRLKYTLGEKAEKVKWVSSDITEFETRTTYSLWHDRATFHFLLTEGQVSKYLDIAKRSVKGFMTLGTFSEQGPKKCSGLQVTQYSEEKLQNRLVNGFEKIRCIHESHITPFNTTQNFLFCSFKSRLKDVRD